MELTPAIALYDLGSFVFGDHALHLHQQFLFRCRTEAVID
jgi:hypothetical protein